MTPTRNEVEQFRETVWEYYRKHGRSMPWRDDPSPYKVLVSELMLQQTQVSRVVPKFNAFMYTCSDFVALAQLSLAEVLGLWSGLGYNRRAKFLHQTAQRVMRDYDGVLPDTANQLIKLPGIGKNTAGAILAYAYNQQVVFIETNIRTVLFHHFYETNSLVDDKELAVLAAAILDQENSREWYWALMDYGSYLKKNAGGRLTDSKHYVKQSPLGGSMREMRGLIVKALVTRAYERTDLESFVNVDERFEPALASLQRDGLIQTDGNFFSLTGERETS